MYGGPIPYRPPWRHGIGAARPGATLSTGAPSVANGWQATEPPSTGSTVTTDYAQGNATLTIAATLEAVADTEPPLVSNVSAYPSPVPMGDSATLSATIDDSTTGDSAIASADYSIDGGAWQPMTAYDDSFDTPTENVWTTLPGDLSAGDHTVCVRGTDAAGNTSAGGGCTTVEVIDVVAPGAPTNVVASVETSGRGRDSTKAVSLAWDAPADNGGAEITGYSIEVYAYQRSGRHSPGGYTLVNTIETDAQSTSLQLPEFVFPSSGSYAFRVAATNLAGTGADSDYSNTVRY